MLYSFVRVCVYALCLLQLWIACVDCANGCGCTDGWVTFQGSCYLFGHEQPMSFLEAEYYCRQHGSNMISVDGAVENAFLKSYVGRLSEKSYGYWLGMTDAAKEGVWRWNDTGTMVTFTDWYPGEPGTGGHLDEDCAALLGGLRHQWGDLICSHAGVQPACEQSEENGGDLVIG